MPHELSCAALQGVNLFRMARDDVFLRLSLRRISHLWRDHVLRGHPPPADAWWSDPDYQVRTPEPATPSLHGATICLSVALACHPCRPTPTDGRQWPLQIALSGLAANVCHAYVAAAVQPGCFLVRNYGMSTAR